MNPLLIYIWGQADSIRPALGIIAVITLIIATIATICFYVETGRFSSKLTIFIGLFIFTCGFCSVFMPSSKTIGYMIVIPEIIKSKAVQQDLPEIYNLAVEKLKEELK